jgi:hypothetical protein
MGTKPRLGGEPTGYPAPVADAAAPEVRVLPIDSFVGRQKMFGEMDPEDTE